MLNKIKFCSFGFLLLVGAIALCTFYVVWTFSPLDHERARTSELKGRYLYANNQAKEAFPYFLSAAEIEDSPRLQSMRYQWAGETCDSLIGKVHYFRQAYILNPNGDFLVDQLKEIPIFNALIIEDQSMNDLTLEEWRKEALAMWPDSIDEILKMYSETSNDEESQEAQETEKSDE